MERRIWTTVRIHRAHARRALRIARAIGSDPGMYRGFRATGSSVIRAALEKGLAALEEEHDIPRR